ncbi:unnamed protein product [Parnassius mnemosyne]|uniref:RING-type domain-containing protein n=1 Tax=Parnassius mnemosyne TaxID=213953 RepID=A0AAV1M1T1_9NEOP
MTMLQECNRLESFKNWPLSCPSGEEMARNGFYYLGHGDEVRCVFCKVEIMKWNTDDDPTGEHRRWAPQCPFMQRRIVVKSDDALYDEFGIRRRRPPPTTPRQEAHGAESNLVEKPYHLYPKYSIISERLNSFTLWPKSLKQTPAQLADAGFFYTGCGDRVTCFCCGGVLQDWDSDDDPWDQHAKWFAQCDYVRLVNGRGYVLHKVGTTTTTTVDVTTTDPYSAAAHSTVINQKQQHSCPRGACKSDENGRLCKICFIEEMNVYYYPCGHVVSCSKCMHGIDKCPLCRQNIQGVGRLYYV